LCHRTHSTYLQSILRDGIRPGGNKRGGERAVHFTKYHPQDKRATYSGRAGASVVLELDMPKVFRLLGKELGAISGSSSKFEFFETKAGCVLCASGVPPCCIARVTDATSRLTLWSRPKVWDESPGTLAPHPQRRRLLNNVLCSSCNCSNIESTSVCVREDCRRPITNRGLTDWIASFPQTERQSRVERLREFGILPEEHGLSKYGTGEREGRILRSIDQQIFSRKWCNKKHGQARKAGLGRVCWMMTREHMARRKQTVSLACFVTGT
jgi:hypothetical protein